jgi:hypothetical protein
VQGSNVVRWKLDCCTVQVRNVQLRDSAYAKHQSSKAILSVTLPPHISVEAAAQSGIKEHCRLSQEEQSSALNTGSTVEATATVSHAKTRCKNVRGFGLQVILPPHPLCALGGLGEQLMRPCSISPLPSTPCSAHDQRPSCCF